MINLFLRVNKRQATAERNGAVACPPDVLDVHFYMELAFSKSSNHFFLCNPPP